MAEAATLRPAAQRPTPGMLRLVLVTYEQKLLELDCDEVTLPGRKGYFGVLPGHVPMIATLKVGELMYRIGKLEHFLAVSWGFSEVSDDVVTVLAEFAQLPHEIDVAAAEQEAAEAMSVLSNVSEDDLRRALAQLEAATVRLQVAARPR
jgi:F-type H+-transporting ATPase subunit epsilon